MASKYATRKATDFQISEESATDQVVELLDYYDIDVDRLTEGEDRAGSALEKALDHVRDGFRSGRLELVRDNTGKLTVVHHLKGAGEPLVYQEISAKAKLAMERFDPAAGYSRLYAFMGALCGIGKGAIEKLPPQDLALVEVLGTVFLTA